MVNVTQICHVVIHEWYECKQIWTPNAISLTTQQEMIARDKCDDIHSFIHPFFHWEFSFVVSCFYFECYFLLLMQVCVCVCWCFNGPFSVFFWTSELGWVDWWHLMQSIIDLDTRMSAFVCFFHSLPMCPLLSRWNVWWRTIKLDDSSECKNTKTGHKRSKWNQVK